ncbi:VOC family protein [Nocardia vaccinii]|uniref:VOC family protein n=1 Tax=Nocardia vaccinii TaxID=1822 RepID=UPI00082F156F|nr:VOC family protein [Nocardia vaccinii]
MSHTYSTAEHGESTAALSMLNIDSADPARLARFYAAALDWEVTYSDDNYGMVEGNGIKIGFGKVEGFRPAQWPDEACAKRFHLDLQVEDLDEATESLCAIGASQPDFQPGAGRWRVLLDPDGQPFCLSPRPAAAP